MKINRETFLELSGEYEHSKIVMFGAPFDSTTSFRPGARFGPSAIRRDSFGIESYSPYQNKDLLSISVTDVGDLELPYGDPKPALDAIETFVARILKDNKIPVMLGGEHLVTLGAIRAINKYHSDLAIIHIDAHSDTRDQYLNQKLSHATVIRRIWDILGDERIYSLGIRSCDKSELEWAKEHLFINMFDLTNIDSVISTIKNKPTYLSIDLDVLDPSIFSGTGTPEPGGISFSELLDLVIKCSKLNIVGADINELAPHYDHSGVSTAVACKITRELLLTL